MVDALHNELLRKIAHAVLAIASAGLGVLLGRWGMAVFGVVLLGLFLYTRSRGSFARLRQVGRVSYGELYFAFGLILAALLYLPEHTPAFASGMLVLGIADPLAALVGKWWGMHRYILWGETRSWEGSTACAVTASVIMVLLGVAMIPACVAGLVLAIIEAVALHGSDNLLLPLVAGVFVLL